MASEKQCGVPVSPRKCCSYQPPPTVAIIQPSKPTIKTDHFMDVGGRSGIISRQRSQSVKQNRYSAQASNMKQRGASPVPGAASQPKYSMWTIMGAPPHISPNLHRNASISEDNGEIGFQKKNARSGSYAAVGEMDKMERIRLQVLRAGMEDGVVKKLRNFSIDPVNGLVNEGDAYRCTTGNRFQHIYHCRTAYDPEILFKPVLSERLMLQMTRSVKPEDRLKPAPKKYKIAVVGVPGVGRGTLIQHFANADQNSSVEQDSTDLTVESASTSSWVGAHSRAKTEANVEHTTVSILLDGEEYELDILKKSLHREQLDTCFSATISAYIFVYSIDNEDSYKKCLTAIDDLRLVDAKHAAGSVKPVVILVGNKSDLERRRVVNSTVYLVVAETDSNWMGGNAKVAAKRRDCKFIEISVAIGHNIDRLLIGALTHVKSAAAWRRRSATKKTSSGTLSPTICDSRNDDDDGDGQDDGYGVKKSSIGGELATINSDEQYDYRPSDAATEDEGENSPKNLLKAVAKKPVVKSTKSTGLSGYGSSFTAARRQIMNRISFKKKKVSKSVEDLFFE
uniref:Uncharacterized protein n=1 Tax=Romanomermis culicivorax TaxID=13658 RepID=A0A915HLN6_ROMCU